MLVMALKVGRVRTLPGACKPPVTILHAGFRFFFG